MRKKSRWYSKKSYRCIITFLLGHNKTIFIHDMLLNSQATGVLCTLIAGSCTLITTRIDNERFLGNSLPQNVYYNTYFKIR